MYIGELIYLLYRGAGRVKSIEAEFRDWSKPPVPRTLVIASDPDAPGGMRWVNGTPFPSSSTSTRRFWFETPGRLRVEVERAMGLVTMGVRDGPHWWLLSDDGEIRRGRQDALPSLLNPPLLAPHTLSSSLWLEPTGTGYRAGREVVCARGVPRSPDAEPISFELEFDREYGTVLRRAAFADGICTNSSEAVSISYDPELDPAIFEFSRDRPATDDGATARTPRQPRGSTPSGYMAWRSRVAMTVWLTGRSGAGKTTIASELERLLVQLGHPCCILDEDVLQAGLSLDLGDCREHRREQVRRAAQAAVLLARSGIVPIVALVSPHLADREDAREIHSGLGIDFLEVWVDTPIAICIERVVGGRSRHGELREHSRPEESAGAQSPYEPPNGCEVVVAGHGLHPRLAAARLVDALRAPVGKSGDRSGLESLRGSGLANGINEIAPPL